MAKQAKNASPMTQDELLELQNDVASLSLQDAKLGRVLDSMLSHLARLNNLDYPVSVEAEAAPVEEAPGTSQAAAPGQEGAQ